jgi:peptidoglycan/LPS O-acetylase OafA/YrhL
MSDRTLIKPLTSVRFFAALAVVIFHSGASFVSMNPHIPTPIKTLLLNGYVGVTFFFVLSGYILHQTYRGRISTYSEVKRFGIARFARLYPVYFVAVLAMLPFTKPVGWGDVPQFLMLQWWVPNGALRWTDWNMPSWTLSVEFFFYLCFPLLARSVARLPSWPIAMICLGFVVFDVATAASSMVDNRQAIFGWMRCTPVPILRLPEFVLGICVAELHFRGKSLSLPAGLVATALVIGLCVSSSPRIAALATALSAMLISSIAADQRSRFARILSMRWLVLLGSASYSMYLMHQPIHFAVLTWLGGAKAVIALQYPILIIGSVIMFLCYEEPMREWIRAIARMKPSAIRQVAGVPTPSKTPLAPLADADSPSP